MIEQSADVLGHCGAVIGGRIIELAGRAVPAVIERNRTPAGARERRHPAWQDPVRLLGGGEAMDQHDRVALTLVEIGDLDLAVPESWHRDF